MDKCNDPQEILDQLGLSELDYNGLVESIKGAVAFVKHHYFKCNAIDKLTHITFGFCPIEVLVLSSIYFKDNSIPHVSLSMEIDHDMTMVEEDLSLGKYEPTYKTIPTEEDAILSAIVDYINRLKEVLEEWEKTRSTA